MVSCSQRIRLPPLIVDGEPKVLHELKWRELQSCFNAAVKASLQSESDSSGLVFFGNESPKWWPTELPWNRNFWDHLPPAPEKATFVRHMLQTCYSFHKQEDVLHLFDVREGEEPHWELVEEGDGQYSLHNKETNTIVWKFNSGYRILPMIALSAKQREKMESSVRSKKRRNPNDAPACRTRLKKASVGEESLTVDVTIPARRRAYSILGSFSPRHSIDSQSDLSRAVSVEADQPRLTCPQCGDAFEESQVFAAHCTQSCQKCRRWVMEKNAYMLGLNLIPKQIHLEIQRQTSKQDPVQPRLHFHHSMSPQQLSRMELTSDLGRLLQPDDKLSQTEARRTVRQYELRCLPRESERTKTPRFPYPNVYRPIRYLKNSIIDYTLTAGDRREAASRKRALRRRVKKECRKCHVPVIRLTPAEIKKWTRRSTSPVGATKVQIQNLGALTRAERRIVDSDRLNVIVPKLEREDIQRAISTGRKRVPLSGEAPGSSGQDGSAGSDILNDSKALELENDLARASGRIVISSPLELEQTMKESPLAIPVLSPVTEGSGICSSAVAPESVSSFSDTVVLPRFGPRNTREQVKLRSVVFASTLFKCHICGTEQLYQNEAWNRIELHVALVHSAVSPVYISRRQQRSPTYQILIVEAFQNVDH